MSALPQKRQQGLYQNGEWSDDGKERDDPKALARRASGTGGGADRALPQPHLARVEGTAQAWAGTRQGTARDGLQGGGGVMDLERIKDRLVKMKAMAERGVGGERDAADRLLREA